VHVISCQLPYCYQNHTGRNHDSMKVVRQLVTSDQYFEVLDHIGPIGFNWGPTWEDSTSVGWDPRITLSAASGEEERQKLMAMHEKKENGDKEAEAHGHNMYLGVCLVNHRMLIEYTVLVERTKHGIWIWCLRMGVCSTPKYGYCRGVKMTWIWLKDP